MRVSGCSGAGRGVGLVNVGWGCGGGGPVVRRRVALVGWFGSDNLGDEMILRLLVGALRTRGGEPFAVTVDAARAGRGHGIEAVVHRGPGQSLGLRRALRDADGLAVAGGIIQSETSPWNIPFRASRLRAAGAGCVMTAAALGVGHGRGPLGRSLSRRALGRFRHLVVRDAALDELAASGS